MDEVILTGPEAGVATLRVNRPDARNALNQNVRRLLAEHFTALGQDEETRCIVLTG
ncbi:MAG: enoyl-CoA hydratase, partial [Azoarcus sp.]|nr:enoyl-CoA hydratase [Azoarcus sp.]